MEMVEDHVALPVLEKMVEAGANPKLRNKAGKSSADLAADANEINVLRFLDVDHSHAALLRDHEIPTGSPFVGSWSRNDDMEGLELKADGSGMFGSMGGAYNVAWKQSGDTASLEMVPTKGKLPAGTTLTGTARITPSGNLKLDFVKTGSPAWTDELSRTQR